MPYVRRMNFYPRPDTSLEVRKGLTDLVMERQAGGDRCSLQVQAIYGEGICYVVVDLFDDLAQLDAMRQRGAAGADSAAAAAKLKARSALLGKPTTITLFETLVPLPPA